MAIEQLFPNDNSTIKGLSKNDFRMLMELSTKESFFVFNDEYFKQTDGVAMGSPLGPTLANAFMCYHEKKWLTNCPLEFKPIYYRRYVDDIFVLFSHQEHLDRFFTYMNSRHNNIRFSKEVEVEHTLPFLDVLVSRSTLSFVTDVYRKSTFSGVLTNFNSFIPTTYKHGLVFTLLFRGFRICSDYNKFHKELEYLKTIFQRNNYPMNVINFCVRVFLNKMHRPKVEVHTVPKREVFFVLPFLGKASLKIRSMLYDLFREKFPACKLRTIFKITLRINSLLKYKDVLPKCLLSGLVYKFKCSSCNATYYGKTKRHFGVRICEHLGMSHLTGKPLQSSQNTAISEHLLNCVSAPSFDDFTTLASESNDFKLLLMESLLIARDKPPLNKNVQSYPLELF